MSSNVTPMLPKTPDFPFTPAMEQEIGRLFNLMRPAEQEFTQRRDTLNAFLGYCRAELVPEGVEVTLTPGLTGLNKVEPVPAQPAEETPSAEGENTGDVSESQK